MDIKNSAFGVSRKSTWDFLFPNFTLVGTPVLAAGTSAWEWKDTLAALATPLAETVGVAGTWSRRRLVEGSRSLVGGRRSPTLWRLGGGKQGGGWRRRTMSHREFLRHESGPDVVERRKGATEAKMTSDVGETIVEAAQNVEDQRPIGDWFAKITASAMVLKRRQ